MSNIYTVPVFGYYNVQTTYIVAGHTHHTDTVIVLPAGHTIDADITSVNINQVGGPNGSGPMVVHSWSSNGTSFSTHDPQAARIKELENKIKKLEDVIIEHTLLGE